MLACTTDHLSTDRWEQLRETSLRRVALICFLPVANHWQAHIRRLVAVLVLFVASVHVLDVPRILKVRAHLGSLRHIGGQRALLIPISVIVVVDTTCDVASLITRRVVHAIFPRLATLVHLADPIDVRRLQLLLRVVVLLVSALDQVLFCLLHTQRTH